MYKKKNVTVVHSNAEQLVCKAEVGALHKGRIT